MFTNYTNAALRRVLHELRMVRHRGLELEKLLVVAEAEYRRRHPIVEQLPLVEDLDSTYEQDGW